MSEVLTVHVELKWLLTRFATPERGASFALQLPAGATVASLLAELTLPPKWIGFVAINGRKVPETHPLAAGDQVQIYPPFLAGG